MVRKAKRRKAEEPAGTPLDRARAVLGGAMSKAADVLAGLLDAQDERVRMRAAEAVLARGGISGAGAADVREAELHVGGRPPTMEEGFRIALDGGGEPAEGEKAIPEFPCPKCGGSMKPNGRPDGTCPHCSVPLQMELEKVEAEPPEEPVTLPCPKCRKKFNVLHRDGLCPRCEAPYRARMVVVEPEPAAPAEVPAAAAGG